MINKETKEILCTDFCNGRKHDFKLLKESGIKLPKNIQLITDTAYQGIKKIHKNSYLPKKKNPLSKSDKSRNKFLSSIRISIENVFCKIKTFKILSERYRNRRKRFSLRFNLIAGIYNYELRQKNA